jgi:hypothetical protein
MCGKGKYYSLKNLSINNFGRFSRYPAPTAPKVQKFGGYTYRDGMTRGRVRFGGYFPRFARDDKVAKD